MDNNDTFKICTFNCNGLGNSSKRRDVFEYLQKKELECFFFFFLFFVIHFFLFSSFRHHIQYPFVQYFFLIQTLSYTSSHTHANIPTLSLITVPTFTLISGPLVHHYCSAHRLLYIIHLVEKSW